MRHALSSSGKTLDVRACDHKRTPARASLLIESDAGEKVKNSGQWSVVSGQLRNCLSLITDHRPLTTSVDCCRSQITNGHLGGRVCGRVAVLFVVGFE